MNKLTLITATVLGTALLATPAMADTCVLSVSVEVGGAPTADAPADPYSIQRAGFLAVMPFRLQGEVESIPKICCNYTTTTREGSFTVGRLMDKSACEQEAANAEIGNSNVGPNGCISPTVPFNVVPANSDEGCNTNSTGSTGSGGGLGGGFGPLQP
jgi:hypothetical protein